MSTQPETLNDAINTGSSPVIVDVRTNIEFHSGHVPGAIHVPFFFSFVRASSVSEDKTSPVVIYCEHGPRAYIAWLGFKLAGFQRVSFLKGHMHGWRRRDLPLN